MKRSITPIVTTANIEYMEFFVRPPQQYVTVYMVQGYEDPGGTFHETSRSSTTIQGIDYDALMAANAQGKKAGLFRNDDVLAAADKIRGV